MMASRRKPQLSIGRIYDHGEEGYRVLVDRLWPRGINKADARLDDWAKDATPSTDLRRWYGHDPAKFEEFARRYRDELTSPAASEAVEHLREVARKRPVTLLTATRNLDHSGARVLLDHLLKGWTT
jgi:uncharacterized protein YeaO (DUF488 family)